MASWSILAPVGSGGANRKLDVYTIQALLNHARVQWGQQQIGVDGVVGGETAGAISDFQKKCFGTSDGRVDPGRRTIAHLNEVFERAPLKRQRIYTHGRYSVTIGEDGRLFVAPSDWLTKYSAAIHGEYWHIFEFGRPGVSGPERIMDYNRIRAGEVLIHLPTYKTYTKVPVPPPKILPDGEKKRITIDALKHDFNVPGNYWSFLSTVGDAIGLGSQALEFLAVFAQSLGKATEIVGFIAVPFEIACNTIDWANAGDAGVRIYGLRAVAYAITAYAFEEPAPKSSPQVRASWMPSNPEQMRRLDRFWEKCSATATAEMDRWANQNGGSNNWRIALRAVGDGQPRKLSLELMKYQEKEILHDAAGWGAVLEMWRHNYSILYKD